MARNKADGFRGLGLPWTAGGELLEYKVDGKSVLFNSGYRVDFEWPVLEVADCDPVLIVMVQPDPGHVCNENVFGVKDGRGVIWTIGRRSHVYEDSPYTGLRKLNGKIKLFNWDGEDLTLDPSDGTVLEVAYGR